MTHPPLPLDEAERLAALRRYDILDTLPEQAFDDLTHLAAHIFNVPIALISFVDAERLWFKSKVGLTVSEVPRHDSFCSHAILEPDVYVIPDAFVDERFTTNPLVTSEPHIRFYAAAKLLTPEGHAIGTVCIGDRVPHKLSAEQEEALRALARQVMAQLELRRRMAEVEHGLSANARARAEILLQASLLSAVEEAVIANDLSGKIVYWNRFAEKMYGWSAAEAVGCKAAELVVPDVSRDEAAKIVPRLRRGESWSGEFIVRRRDGSSFPAHVTASPIRDSGGALIGTVGISTDITERKLAEEALGRAHAELERRVAQRTAELTAANAFLKKEIDERKRTEQALLESHDLLQAVIEGTTDFVYVKDLNGRYLLINSAAAKFVGKSAAEIIGKDDTYLFPPETARRVMEHDRLVIAGGEPITHEESGVVEGERRTVISIKSAYRNDEGKVIGLIGISRDITERKQAEEKISESEQQLAAAQKIARMGSWAWDIATNKVSWSDELYRIFGLGPQEFSPSYDGFVERVHPEDREFVKGIIEKALRDHKPFTYDFRAVLPNGKVRTLRCRGEVVAGDSGRAAKMYGTVEDITERKLAERAVRLTPTLMMAWLVALASLTLIETAQKLLGSVVGELPSLILLIVLGSLAATEIVYLALRRQKALYRRTFEEITERHRLGEVLRESEEHFRLLVGGINEYAIFMLDTGGRITNWNEGATRLTGYLPEESIGQHFSICCTAEDIAQGRPERALEIAETEDHFEDECLLVRKGGSQFWANVIITALRDEEGRVRGFAEITRDITERKQTEETLKQSERDYRRLFENAHDAILIFVPEDEIVLEVNQRACEVYGFSHSEFLGMSLETISRNVERGKVHVEETLKKGTFYNFETIQYRKDGTEMFLDVNASVVEYKGQRTILSINRDVTERKRAEEELRASEENYRHLVELSPDAILVHSEGNVVYINPAGVRMFGATSPEQIVGRSVFDLLHPDSHELVKERIRQTRKGQKVGRVEEKFVRLDGQIIYTEVTGIGITYHEKPATQALVRDITERVQAREARIQLQRRLLEAQEEERRRFSRELHDQMGQHLPALMLGLETLNQADPSEPPDADRLRRLKDLVKRIARDTHALARDLRPPVLDDFGLQVALSTFLEEWSGRYGIEADFHSNGFNEDGRLPPQVEITVFRIAQEALTNVAKHAQARHVSLILRRSRGGEVQAIVEDDGKGFNVEDLRSESIGKRHLGFQGMKERVELVGGALEIESVPGAGTTVAIRIPTHVK